MKNTVGRGEVEMRKKRAGGEAGREQAKEGGGGKMKG
jgi:hypothetical protein